MSVSAVMGVLSDLAINGAEAAGVEDFCFEHEVWRDVDYDMIRRLVVGLKFRRHSFGGGCAVGHRLEYDFGEFHTFRCGIFGDLLEESFTLQ